MRAFGVMCTLYPNDKGEQGRRRLHAIIYDTLAEAQEAIHDMRRENLPFKELHAVKIEVME